ncbi:MAG: hypothetical protein KGR18_00945 [Acidobacteria bacterium]|nr:hypothetical protein [Acidobacteriota bacterium]
MPAADDELQPWWMHRQSDPSSPDVIIGDAAQQNTTHRSWTLLGTVGSPSAAAVDPRGLVSLRRESASIDWWVGADDRWHLPSRSAGVRQRSVDGAPVVETIMRVPGGEVVHRAWAVAGGEDLPGGAVILELHNASSVPVAVAFAIRPFGPLGRVSVGRIDLHDTVVEVDGAPILHLSRQPSRLAVGSAELGDSLGVVLSGEAGPDWPAGGVRCGEGRASAALLFPLPHTATIRVVAPLAPLLPSSRRSRSTAVGAPTGAAIASLPGPDRVVAGWEALTRRAPRLELLERRAPEALAAARRSALLHAAGDEVLSWSEGPVSVFDACALVVALDQHGLGDEAARVLMTLDDRIGITGRFEGEERRVDAGAAWLHAIAHHVRCAADVVLARTLMGDIAKVAHRVHRDVMGARRTLATTGPQWVGSSAATRLHDLLWAAAGLRAAAEALRVADQPDAAAEIDSFLVHVESSCRDALAGPIGSTDAPAVLAALVETDTGVEDPEVGVELLGRLVGSVLEDHPDGVVWSPGRGDSVRLTVALGIARARLGDPDAVAALRWMLDIGEPMWAWPDHVHPRTGGGSAGEGHAPASTAAFLRLVRALTVLEGAGSLDVLPAVPADWLGRPVEVHALPTRHGRLSFAVRWHGARPAVLWELTPAPAGTGTDASGPVSLGFGGLDPDWSTTELRGEALLVAPMVGTEPQADPQTDLQAEAQADPAADGPASSGSGPFPAAATEGPEEGVSFG